MKAIKQRFHQEIVKKYKANYFATIRKQILQIQQFQSLYHKILDNNQDLIILIQQIGYIVFYKHIHQILDEKLYQKLYQNQKYFLQNLAFLNYLVQSQALPTQQIQMLISGLFQIIRKFQNKISAQNIKQIFQIVEKIIDTQKYFPTSLEIIGKEDLILRLYELMIKKEMNENFFKIIHFCKILGNQKITKISYKQQLHCLQIHILTSNKIQELYTSYSELGNIFQKVYIPEEQLFEYGSILDKTMKDIVIDRLIDPISYFLLKALNNNSLNKLLIEMNCIEVIFNVILNNLLRKSTVSAFGHHSMWLIFKKILTNLTTNKVQSLNELDWANLRQKLQQINLIKFNNVKEQIYSTLSVLSKTPFQSFFADIISKYYQPQQEQIQI